MKYLNLMLIFVPLAILAALLHLRYIEVNNAWEAFITFVHDRTSAQAQQERRNLSLKCTEPASLPTYGLT